MVEDDPSQRRLLVRVLRRVGNGDVEIVEAATVAEARAAVGPFDVVVCDWSLTTRIDPTATAMAVREAWPGVPFVVISGYERRPEYGSEGPWLLKPVAPEELMGVIATLLAHHGNGATSK